MQKTKDQLNKEYEWGIQFLWFLGMNMSIFGDPDCKYKNYDDFAKGYAELRSNDKTYVNDYWQSITDLQTMLAKEMDSWEVIGDAAYTGLDGRDDAKKWLGDEVIPALLAEAERRGWKKPA
ncbi:MAG: hypothetical protein IPP67_05930 [Rhodospirillaceae bacterium]|nr:hypothetical protein [Rhodospirillaceae bacterium]